MAQKRMFDKSITNSDEFLDLPDSTQVLYFHLSMNADDDGFVNNWKSILRMTGTKEDDMKLLIAKSFIIPFDSGVIVIKHWRINNFLRKDRHIDTKFQNELSKLSVNDNQEYVWLTTGQPSIDKIRIDKNSIEYKEENIIKEESKPEKHKYGEYKHVLLTDKEYNKLKNDYDNYEDLIKYLDEYIEMKGYKAKSHYLCIKKWVIDAVKKDNSKNFWKTEDKKVPKWINQNIESEEVSKEELEDFKREWNDIF